MAYEITAPHDGYRRAGMAHRSTPTVHPSDAFTKEQLAQLEADPRIMIREVPDTALDNPDNEAVAASETLLIADTREDSEFLTSKQAAKIARVSVRRLQKWVEARRLRTVRRRPRTLIDRRDLDEFLRNQAPLLVLMEDDVDESQLLTAEQAAEIAKVHLHTVQKWVSTDRLRAVRQRPKVLIGREDLDEFLRNRTPTGREAAHIPSV